MIWGKNLLILSIYSSFTYLALTALFPLFSLPFTSFSINIYEENGKIVLQMFNKKFIQNSWIVISFEKVLMKTIPKTQLEMMQNISKLVSLRRQNSWKKNWILILNFQKSNDLFWDMVCDGGLPRSSYLVLQLCGFNRSQSKRNRNYDYNDQFRIFFKWLMNKTMHQLNYRVLIHIIFFNGKPFVVFDLLKIDQTL